MDTTTDHHFHSVQTGHSCLKTECNKPASKTKACNTDVTFGPSDSVTFFIDKLQQSDEDNNLEESFILILNSLKNPSLISDDYVSYDPVINSDDDGDIELLNSSEDPLKRSKLIVIFVSSIQKKLKSQFSVSKKSSYLKTRNSIENGHKNQ